MILLCVLIYSSEITTCIHPPFETKEPKREGSVIALMSLVHCNQMWQIQPNTADETALTEQTEAFPN